MYYDAMKAADLLRRFCRGDVSDWELDDFISGPIDDPQLEAIRIEIGMLPQAYPSNDPAIYASPEGLARILEIAEALEASG